MLGAILRCCVDFQVVKKTQLGPMDPTDLLNRSVALSEKKKLPQLNNPYVFSLESYSHPKRTFQELMDKVKKDSENFSARGKGVIWDNEVYKWWERISAGNSIMNLPCLIP